MKKGRAAIPDKRKYLVRIGFEAAYKSEVLIRELRGRVVG